jgi:hypothetical protein
VVRRSKLGVPTFGVPNMGKFGTARPHQFYRPIKA